MKKKRTKQEERIDMKQEVLKLIILNSEDGCTQKDIIEHFDLSSTLARTFITELQIEDRIKEVTFNRFKIYKENKK